MTKAKNSLPATSVALMMFLAYLGYRLATQSVGAPEVYERVGAMESSISHQNEELKTQLGDVAQGAKSDREALEIRVAALEATHISGEEIANIVQANAPWLADRPEWLEWREKVDESTEKILEKVTEIAEGRCPPVKDNPQ